MLDRVDTPNPTCVKNPGAPNQIAKITWLNCYQTQLISHKEMPW